MKFIIINDYSNSEDRLRVESDEPITSQFIETKTVYHEDGEPTVRLLKRYDADIYYEVAE